MAKREFLQLAHTYEEKSDVSLAGWFASEKLDGMRCLWDGGFTRGKSLSAVPFANTTKDGRYLTQPKATGLWTRYGKTIQAPDWFLDKLPPYPLDGELYMGRGSFQETLSTVKQMNPDSRWLQVKFMIFDSPPTRIVFGPGEINNTNFKKKIPVFDHGNISAVKDPQFWKVYDFLSRELGDGMLQQEVLPPTRSGALERLQYLTECITSKGGEGVMLRHPTSFWVPQRTRTLLKCKPFNDDEGTVIGYTWGRETDLGSKLLGAMGALVLSCKSVIFELSGFTDAERVMVRSDLTLPLAYDAAIDEGEHHPGERCAPGYHNPKFPLGSKVTFKYRELSEAGIPKEARYYRSASDE